MYAQKLLYPAISAINVRHIHTTLQGINDYAQKIKR